MVPPVDDVEDGEKEEKMSASKKIVVSKDVLNFSDISFDEFCSVHDLEMKTLQKYRSGITITDPESLDYFTSLVSQNESLSSIIDRVMVIRLESQFDFTLYQSWQDSHRENLRNLKQSVVMSNEELKRSVNAYEKDSEDVVILSAKVSGRVLYIANCAGDVLTIDTSELSPALAQLSEKELSDFKIHEYGFYISWKDRAVEMDYEGLQYLVDDDFRKKVDRETIQKFEGYGRAIAKLRKKHDLTQADILGYSPRQIGRIEKEDQTVSSKVLVALAKSHKLSYEEYISELLEFLES